ncbi:phage antirepressor KilAC domain-containing protein [Aeromonas salmonicida]|uniref:phage antirepressor KilAC domain-containing protein n=1 Tax=Aeromonas salmonicida TaxID=645 RepID=UPI00259E3F2F|nr:phage antirepressor KilAC domain-containing protein [Aeromonas salmonicida]MDM5134079.1 phage antirepressor KilAC domain-containing protein [Aeromonas salmonicida]
MTIQQQYQQTKVLTGPLNGDCLSMNSQEIADLVDSRHDNVKRAIDRLASKDVIQLPPMEDCGRINGLGINQAFSVYVFTGKQGKRDSLIVVAQLCPEFTARIVDRWQELEEKLAQPDPMAVLNDPAAMRGLLLTYTEKVLVLEEQVEGMKPKVDALDRIATADGSLNLTEAAKALQQQPKKFNQHLCSQRWIYKRAGGKQWLGYQDKVQQGLVEHKVTMVPLTDGSERLCEQVRITPKGLTKLAQQLSVGGVQ